MLHVQRQNHNGIFASLALVDGYGPREREFREIGIIVTDSSLVGELDDHFLLFQVDADYCAHISIEHLALVVVDLLNHPVANTQDTPATRQFCLSWFGRIKDLLEHDVELPRADLATGSRTEYLHLLSRVDSAFWEKLAHQMTNTLRTQFWFRSL